MEVQFSGVRIVVGKGDITKAEVDTIVNAANSYLTMGGGVAGAIRRAGGRVIEDEAVRKGPIPVGKAVATTAGALKARFVIHAPTMEVPGPTTPDKVFKATVAALKCAEEIGAVSVAVPGMGTGVGRVLPQDAAEAIVKAVEEHIQRGSKMQRIILIDIDDEMVEAFKQTVDRLG